MAHLTINNYKQGAKNLPTLEKRLKYGFDKSVRAKDEKNYKMRTQI